MQNHHDILYTHKNYWHQCSHITVNAACEWKSFIHSITMPYWVLWGDFVTWIDATKLDHFLSRSDMTNLKKQKNRFRFCIFVPKQTRSVQKHHIFIGYSLWSGEIQRTKLKIVENRSALYSVRDKSGENYKKMYWLCLVNLVTNMKINVSVSGL